MEGGGGGSGGVDPGDLDDPGDRRDVNSMDTGGGHPPGGGDNPPGVGDHPLGAVGPGNQQQKLIVDGLLSCTMRALSRSASHGDLVTVIVRDFNEQEVKSSWTKLFEHFNDAFDVAQKKRILDINRKTTKNRVEDIVGQLSKVDKESVANMLVMPWNYKINDLETDSEKLTSIMVDENAKDYDAKFEAFEKKMDKKHSELCDGLQNLLHGLISGQQQRPATFANIVGQQNGGAGRRGRQAAGAGNNGQERDYPPLQQGNKIRDISPSVKRFRAEDSTAITANVQDNSQNNSRPRSQNRPKPVVGTSDSLITGRKMKSPPADIFVWGVHPETTIEDIINDLAASDLNIRETDIVKKSNKDAYLCSYKISVPAQDLQKALDPNIWPLRVKVREFIHYPNRNARAAGGQAERGQTSAHGGGHGGRHGGGHTGESGGQPGQLVGGNHQQDGQGGARPKTAGVQLQVPTIELNNMFSALATTRSKSL